MKNRTRELVALLLTAVLLLSAAPAALAEEPAEPDRSLSWSKAFLDDTLPEGFLTPEVAAFYAAGDEGKPEIRNVPLEEVLDWWNRQDSLPRTRYFEKFMPERLEDLYPFLDYAFAHSCSSFCVPTTTFTATDIAGGWKYLPLTYRINNRGISTLTPASFDLGDGRTLQYVTVTLRGMEKQGVMSEYQQSLAAARDIVAGIPEGSSEYEKALYLYQWLTDNVYYDYGDYYESEWNLLYDTLVKKKTVCAGYAEALYVMYNLAGIECFTVYGSIYRDGDWSNHIWNVARIDGEYYLFDATWDAGSLPDYYLFFGISEERMQAFYPRILLGQPEEYCPPCTLNLPRPNARALPEALAALSEGSLEEGVYSQPFWNLRLCVDDSWTIIPREEIESMYFGESFLAALDLKEHFAMGLPYVDLILARDDTTVQIILEQGPITLDDGKSYDSAESYADALFGQLGPMLEAFGASHVNCERFETEINGESYQCVMVVGKTGWRSTSMVYNIAQREGCFLQIVISSSGSSVDELMQELLNGPDGA